MFARVHLIRNDGKAFRQNNQVVTMDLFVLTTSAVDKIHLGGHRLTVRIIQHLQDFHSASAANSNTELI